MERLSTGWSNVQRLMMLRDWLFPQEWNSDKRLTMAVKNAHDGISVIGTEGGAMEEITAMLQRMRELAIQSQMIPTAKKTGIFQDEVNQLIRKSIEYPKRLNLTR